MTVTLLRGRRVVHFVRHVASVERGLNKDNLLGLLGPTRSELANSRVLLLL